MLVPKHFLFALAIIPFAGCALGDGKFGSALHSSEEKRSEEKQSNEQVAHEIAESIARAADKCAAAITSSEEPTQEAINTFTDKYLSDIRTAVYASGKPAAIALTFAAGESIALAAGSAAVTTSGFTYRFASIPGPDPEPGFEKEMGGKVSLKIISEIDNAHCTFGGPRRAVRCESLDDGVLVEGWRCTPSFIFRAQTSGESFEVQEIEFSPHVVKHTACRGTECVTYEPETNPTQGLALLGSASFWPTQNILDPRLTDLMAVMPAR